MTDYERRQLAAQSLESNVRDENFCELFPELTMVKFANMPIKPVAQPRVFKCTLIRFICCSSIKLCYMLLINSNNLNSNTHL